MSSSSDTELELEVSFNIYNKEKEVLRSGAFDCNNYPALIHFEFIPADATLMKIRFDCCSQEDFDESDEYSTDSSSEESCDSFEKPISKKRKTEPKKILNVSLKYIFYDKEKNITESGFIDCSNKKMKVENVQIPENSWAFSISYCLNTENNIHTIEKITDESDDVYFFKEGKADFDSINKE